MFLKKERVWFVLSEEVLCSATSQVYCQEKWETLFLVSSATSSRNNRELIITLMSKLEKHIVSNSSRESSSI